MFLRKRNPNNGFTLVELLVTISVFVILTGVVLWNQSKFNSTILLTNLAYDTALTIRQAQTYGINIKEFATSSASAGQFVPYGVHFEKGAKSFILFADIDYTVTSEDDGTVTRFSDGVYLGLTTSCSSRDGCVNRYNIQRGNYIKELCVGSANPTGECEGGTGVDTLNIVFTRPNPDARIIISRDESDEQSEATIVLGSTDDSVRRIHIMKNGLIEIVQ